MAPLGFRTVADKITPPLAKAALVLALAAGAQSVLTSYLPETARVFDFFLIVAVYYAMTTRQVAGMFVGLACGR